MNARISSLTLISAGLFAIGCHRSDAGQSSSGELRENATLLDGDCKISIERGLDATALRWTACDALEGVSGCRRLSLGEGKLAELPLINVGEDGDFDMAVAVRSEDVKSWLWKGGGEITSIRKRFPESRCSPYLEQLLATELRLAVRRNVGASEQAVDLVAVSAMGGARVMFRGELGEISTFTGSLRAVAPSRRLERIGSGAVLHDPRADGDGLAIGATRPIEFDDRVFFEIGRAGVRALMTFTAGEEARPLRRYPIAADRAAGNLGSDGRDLVWTEGSGRTDHGTFSRTEVFTAPVSDPRRVRRVAPDVTSAVGGAPFVVGCRTAGHRSAEGIALIDLESGRTTELPPQSRARWGEIIAISCREVFVTYFIGGEQYLARLPKAWRRN